MDDKERLYYYINEGNPLRVKEFLSDKS